MPGTLHPDATLHDIVDTHPKPRSFVAGIRHIMFKTEKDRGPVVVRIGVMGEGISPNFRIDAANGLWSLGAFDGVSYQPFNAVDRIGNWSTARMSLPEVDMLLTELTRLKRK
jgi:hypothetical protein